MSLPPDSAFEAGQPLRTPPPAGASPPEPVGRTGQTASALDSSGLRRVLANAGFGVCEFDPESGEMHWSPECAALLGLDPSAPPALENFLAGVHPDDRAALRRALLAPPRRMVHEFRAAAPGNTDGERWLCLEGSASESDGRLAGVVRDVSEHVRLRAVARSLADDVSGRDHRRIEFFVMLAHELRNPLAALDGAAQAVALGDHETHAWASGVIARQVRFLSHLIDDLLDVSRLTAGKIELRREMIHVPTALAQAAEAVGPQVTRRGHALHVECRAASALWLAADATRLAQIVTNLLINGIKYTEPGGQIWLEAWAADNEIVIQVRDTGIGIDPARLPEVFRLFVQERRSQAHAEGGLGVGLSIVRRLVELHGGRVAAHSDGIGRGCTFSVCLPAAAEPLTDAAGLDGALPAVAEEPAETKRSGRRILVVDDHLDAAHSLGRLLRAAGHEVEIAGDGASALATVKRFHPEVALLDLELPGGMDGHEVAARMRADGCHDCRLIAVSGYGEAEDRRRAKESGIDHFLVKPVSLTRLRELLAEDRVSDPT